MNPTYEEGIQPMRTPNDVAMHFPPFQWLRAGNACPENRHQHDNGKTNVVNPEEHIRYKNGKKSFEHIAEQASHTADNAAVFENIGRAGISVRSIFQ